MKKKLAKNKKTNVAPPRTLTEEETKRLEEKTQFYKEQRRRRKLFRELKEKCYRAQLVLANEYKELGAWRHWNGRMLCDAETARRMIKAARDEVTRRETNTEALATQAVEIEMLHAENAALRAENDKAKERIKELDAKIEALQGEFENQKEVWEHVANTTGADRIVIAPVEFDFITDADDAVREVHNAIFDQDNEPDCD